MTKSLLEEFIDEINLMRNENRKSSNIHIWENSASDYELFDLIIPTLENQMNVEITGGNVGMQYQLTITLND